MSPNVQKAGSPKARRVQIAYCRLLQSWIYKNELEQNFISLLL